MALSAKLELRQSQALVMTPQLQQAIKLLQLSNIELSAYVESELERNPLLERDERPEGEAGSGSSSDDTGNGVDAGDAAAPNEQDAWLELSQTEDKTNPTGDLDTDFENVFPDAGPGAISQFSDSGWSTIRPSKYNGSGEDANLESYVAETVSLKDHLLDQLNLSQLDTARRLIAQHLVDMVDEAGYLSGDLESVSDRLGAPLEMIEETLHVLQGFEPSGVFARNIAECLTLQLKEQGTLNQEMADLLDHLDLLGAHNFPALKKACGINDSQLNEMIRKIKSLNPKPGLIFGSVTVQPVVPDVFVYQRADGAWHVELNSETLPRVLVNRTYYTTVSKTANSDKDKSYLTDCLQTANWLAKSLDQRARTILKVSEEIVRQQDAFFTHGVQHLRPLNLKTVADAIKMHESTVSRVTSNKYMATNRGIFELKYFFTSAIASSDSGEAHSSEAVRHRIKQLIDDETAKTVLSDDKIVSVLQAEGIDIARRTVAKYREAMRIPSSVQRRRLKKMQMKADA